jgi:hypothetical protein
MLKPTALRLDWTFCAIELNGTPLMVKSLG